jgi:hypothetical protein
MFRDRFQWKGSTRSRIETAIGARSADVYAGFLLPHLRPDMALLDSGCGEATITIGLAEPVPTGRWYLVYRVKVRELGLENVLLGGAAERALRGFVFLAFELFNKRSGRRPGATASLQARRHLWTFMALSNPICPRRSRI